MKHALRVFYWYWEYTAKSQSSYGRRKKQVKIERAKSYSERKKRTQQNKTSEIYIIFLCVSLEFYVHYFGKFAVFTEVFVSSSEKYETKWFSFLSFFFFYSFIPSSMTTIFLSFILRIKGGKKSFVYLKLQDTFFAFGCTKKWKVMEQFFHWVFHSMLSAERETSY